MTFPGTRTLLMFGLLLTALSAGAEEPDIAALFERYGAEGSMIVASLDGGTEYIHNEPRSTRRYLPASTFKIPNTLIALSEGVIADENELIPWDGKEREWQAWNRDQTLRSAFALSCVWCYQRFAAEIGDERYRRYLAALDYGNRLTGEEVTTFWLEGALAISVREQIDFLRRLYREALPFEL